MLLFALTGEASARSEFTVATYNVLYRNRDLPELVQTIRGLQADLVALQETNPESEAVLRRELPREFPHMAFRGGRGSDGLGFLSKRPLRNLVVVEPLPGWRGAWIAEVELGGTNVQVASVHFATPKPASTASPLAVMTAFQQAEVLHTNEMQRLYERLSPQQPTLVLGDFNSFSFFLAPQFLKAKGYADSFAAVTENADRQGTWQFRSGQGELPFRIDYIFHTAQFETVESRIVKSDASDHYPVVSRLRWR